MKGVTTANFEIDLLVTFLCFGYVKGEILQAMLLSVVKSAQDLSQGEVKQKQKVKDLSQGET